jgi:hypothetical protein
MKMLTTDKAKEAILKAKQEIAEENLKKAVELLKKKLREREAAQVVLTNIDREISELELKIEQGNI